MSRQLDYWTRRERARQADLAKQQDKALDTIKGQLNVARREIQKLISAFWGNYAGAMGLSITDAYKLASKMDVQDFADKAAEYVKNRDFSDQANSELKTYNLKMRVNRYELLLREIDLELSKLGDKNIKVSKNMLSKVAIDEFTRQAGILGPSVVWAQAEVDALITANHQNATFMDRWYNSSADLQGELDRVIRAAIISGRHPAQFAPQVARKFDTATWEARRLLITETANVQTSVQKRSFERSGFTQGRLIAEASACSICLPLNGKLVELKDMEPGVSAPPIHPNCRCSIVPAFEDKDWDNSLDRRGIKSLEDSKSDEAAFIKHIAEYQVMKLSHN